MEIELKNVSKSYNETQKVLENINLHLHAGMFGLLGANGAGKTTLIRILATVLEQSSGDILYDGEIMRNSKRIRGITGYIPQEFSFYPNMTVFETLDYFCCLAEIKRKNRRAHIEQLLQQVNLWEERRKKTKALSGGMRQRLGIAVALVGNPQILLVDEPTVGLDPRERMKFRNILVEFSKSKIVLLSTHIVSDIEETCQNLAIMNQGRLIFNGTKNELLDLVRGHVWEALLDNDEQKKMENEHIITGKMVLETGTSVRMLAKEQPIQSAQTVEPNLQDAYMYIIGTASSSL